MTNLVEFMRLLPEFRAASWNSWREQVLTRLTPEVREFFAIVGRGAGKSRIVALLACWFAVREYRRVAGESIFIGVFAPDRKQAGVTFRYVVGMLRSVPQLSALIVTETKDSIELSNGVVVEVLTASIAAPRGRAYALVIIEEAAFLPADHSANPDVELLRAVRPALARVPGSLLAVVSSPYARRGVLWQAWQKFGANADPTILVVQADTPTLNPAFDQRAIARAYEDDPASALAEYGAQFRSDVETFVSAEALAECVAPGRHELPPVHAVDYAAFVDPAGGSGTDSFTLAVGHRGAHGAVLDCVRERKPPFAPEHTVAEFAALLKTYRITTVVGDRFAGEWPREQFRKYGIEYATSDRAKSELYRDALPLLNSGTLELLDVPRLHQQLQGLERRTARGGRDSIDHAPGQHDDLANVVCGVAVLVAVEPEAGFCSWGEHDERNPSPTVRTALPMPRWVAGDDDRTARAAWLKTYAPDRYRVLHPENMP